MCPAHAVVSNVMLLTLAVSWRKNMAVATCQSRRAGELIT